jgi:hypothetical protein
MGMDSIKNLVVIVDMDQPGNRMFVGLEEGVDSFDMAKFSDLNEIRTLKNTHPLGVFMWVVVNMKRREVLDTLI